MSPDGQLARQPVHLLAEQLPNPPSSVVVCGDGTAYGRNTDDPASAEFAPVAATHLFREAGFKEVVMMAKPGSEHDIIAQQVEAALVTAKLGQVKAGEIRKMPGHINAPRNRLVNVLETVPHKGAWGCLYPHDADQPGAMGFVC